MLRFLSLSLLMLSAFVQPSHSSFSFHDFLEQDGVMAGSRDVAPVLVDDDLFSSSSIPYNSYTAAASPSSSDSSSAFERMHPNLVAATEAPADFRIPEPEHLRAANSSHKFRTMQAPGTVFTMQRMCVTAPWSARIQPAVLQQHQTLTYQNALTGTTVSQKKDYLLLFEGSLARVNAAGQYTNENDVWASGDMGRTWDLVAGISRFGTSGVVSSRNIVSFAPRAGANNCEDPSSDLIYSIGGTVTDTQGRLVAQNSVFFSPDALSWFYYVNPRFTGRYFSSCDVDPSGHVFSMGGITVNPTTFAQSLLNDVWSNEAQGWNLATLQAPWAARGEHMTFIHENKHLGRSIIYVMGGHINVAATNNVNDVWASSDAGVTWSLICERAGWQKRWGAAGLVTNDGVILVLGGSDSLNNNPASTYSFRDIFASYDGGASWHQCLTPEPYDARDWIRTEQGITITDEGFLVIASGYAFCPIGQCPQTRYDFRDVWVSDWNVENTQEIARRCGGLSAIPARGVGLLVWPGSTVNPRAQFLMTAQTHRAPWSARIQPALLKMDKPITYRQASTGLTVATPPEWLLLYEGGLAFRLPGQLSTAENDVFASADEGKTWDLVGGISSQGTLGNVQSSSPMTSFVARGGSTNCENPVNDDVYSLAGVFYDQDNDRIFTNAVWYSSDAQHWVERKGGRYFAPGRFFASCDIDDHDRIVIIGGATQRVKAGAWQLLNDVWMSTDKGMSFSRTAFAEFSPRAEHSLVQTHSNKFKKDLLYVIGGWVRYDEQGNSFVTTNDVWVSSDFGAAWHVVTETPAFKPRWGHTTVVTESGILLVSGGSNSLTGRGADYTTYRDVYVSINGGYQWASCRVPASADYIRTEQAAQLTGDERLILATGYAHQLGGQRRSYSDVYITTRSISDVDWLATVCVGVVPELNGRVGLQIWPGPSDEELNPPAASNGVQIALAILGVVAALAVFGYTLNFYCTNGRLPFMGSSESNATDKNTADFSNFSVASSDDKSDAVSTEGNGESLNSKFLSS